MPVSNNIQAFNCILRSKKYTNRLIMALQLSLNNILKAEQYRHISLIIKHS